MNVKMAWKYDLSGHKQNAPLTAVLAQKYTKEIGSFCVLLGL